MDPELLNLFLQAAQSGGGRSKVLSSLNNPLLPFLAGVYSPPVDTGMGGGSLWATYANNPDYPELQPIIQAIQSGADKYQTQEAVNRALGGNTSVGFFSDKNLMNLASDLQKEYSGGGTSGSKGKTDVFAKAGLRNPTDIYGISDVPLPAAVQRLVGENMQQYTPAMEALGSARQSLSSAQGAARKSKKTINSIADTILEVGTLSSGGAQNLKDLSNWVRKQNDIDSMSLNKAIQDFTPDARYQSIPYQTKIDAIMKRLDRAGGKYKTPSGAAKNLAAAEAKKNAAELEVNKVAGIDSAYRKGVLRAYQEMGQTPAKDQMAQILKFIAATGK
jgi:hypothetical protein